MTADVETDEETLTVSRHDNAYVAPIQTFRPVDPDRGHGWYDGGAFDDTTAFIPNAAHRFAVMHHEPRAPQGEELGAEIEGGRYLYLGILDNVHFGHFISDGMARLWAASLAEAPNRLVYSFQRPHAGAGKFMEPVLRAFLGDKELIPVTHTRRFERLWVPQAARFPGGFVRGTPQSRAFFAQAVDRILTTTDTATNGPVHDKIYVSRTGLPLEHPHAALLFESLIEDNLRQEGYHIVHPQTLPFDQQLLMYRNAKQLIFAEGSALHVYPFAGTPDQSCFCITRSRFRFQQFDDQIASFGLAPLQRSPLTAKQFSHVRNNGPSTAYLGTVDLVALRAALVQGGFISGKTWQLPSLADYQHEMARLSAFYTIDADALAGAWHRGQ